MKIIFLDIDGVLNSEDDFKKQEKYNYTNWTPGADIFHNKIKLLQKIVNRTGAKIVLSSSWRYSDKLYNFVKSLLNSYGLEIIGRTPDGVTMRKKHKKCHFWWKASAATQSGETLHKYNYTTDRGYECLTYIKKNWFRFITNYILIDDDDIDIKNWIKDKHFVHTTYAMGLTLLKAEEAIEKLNR